MDKIITFFEVWKTEGWREAINRTYEYIIYIDPVIDIPTFLNAVRFRDHRIYFSCDIEHVLPKSTKIRHPTGIVVHRAASLGENVQINQNVTIGSRGGLNPSGPPVIEDNVTIYSNSVVLGDVTLHDGCTVGANSVVLEDVAEGETVVGSPATKIQS